MKRRIWFPLILLVLSSLACSLFGAAEEAVDVGQEVATEAAEAATAVGEELVTTPEESGQESGEAGEEADAPALDPDALAGLDSYRTRVRIQWVPEEGDPEGMALEQENTRDPRAQRYLVEGGEGGEDFEFVQIEDQAWFCAGDMCSQADADPEELIAGFGEAMMFDPTDMTDDANATFVGREQVNGVQSRHYTLNLSQVETALLAQGEVSDVQGDVWVADEPGLKGFPVRFRMSWNETRDERAGMSELFYEVYDVNEPIDIQPPEGAEESGLPEDVPAYPNAEDVFSMGGMTTFTTPDDGATVADFYREGLPAQGWTNAQDEEMGEAVNQVWTKDGRQLVIMIASQEGETTVSLMIE